MRVSNDNASQFRQFSGTEKIGGIALPDFDDDYVYTSKKTRKSKSDYKKEIIEQAIKDQAEGVFQNKSDGYRNLQKRYVSEVSPDRKGIITEGLKRIAQECNRKSIDTMELLLTGKIKYHNKSVSSTYIEFYDSNGEMVAKYSNGGWTVVTTEAESSRQMEMRLIYNDAWKQARDAAKNKELSVTPNGNVEEIETTFDKKA